MEYDHRQRVYGRSLSYRGHEMVGRSCNKVRGEKAHSYPMVHQQGRWTLDSSQSRSCGGWNGLDGLMFKTAPRQDCEQQGLRERNDCRAAAQSLVAAHFIGRAMQMGLVTISR